MSRSLTAVIVFSGMLLSLLDAKAAQSNVRPTVNIVSCGAAGDGTTDDTAAIQAAVNKCYEVGGGAVDVPAGNYVTGSIVLKDNVLLRLDKGATLLGSTNPADYQAIDPFTDGVGIKRGEFLIAAFNAKNVGITGQGVIDGRGPMVLAAQAGNSAIVKPFLVRWVSCSGVTVSGISLIDSAAWTMNFAGCDRCEIDDVTIHSRGLGNNDGIDIDYTSDVVIKGCNISSDDDSICLKSTRPLPCRNITISECTLNSACAAFKTGTESMGDFRHVRMTDCTITGAGMGGIDIFSVDGAHIDDFDISNIKMTNVFIPICLRLGARLKIFHEGDSKQPVGSLSNVKIDNVQADSKDIAILVSGIPGHPVENVHISNITVSLPGGGTTVDAERVLPENIDMYPTPYMFGTPPASDIYLRHVNRLTLTNITTTFAAPDNRPHIVTLDANNVVQN